MKQIVVVLVLGAVLLTAIGAGEQPQPRLITVTGEAEIKVVPNEVIITLGVETINKKLNVAKIENDDSVKKILALAPQFGVEPKYVQTSINIRPVYEKQSLLYYQIDKTIVFILKDISKFEGLLSACLEAGENNLYGVQFRTTESRKHKDQVRSLAIKAAQEKADALAKELGQKVGRPYTIKEEPIAEWLDRNVSNFVNDSYIGAGLNTEETIALGQIIIKAKITVSFELKE